MIHTLNVKDLNNIISFNFNFNSDLNIFTGKNGSGKTTVIKLIWYLTSGNLSQIFEEIEFKNLYFKSDSVVADFNVVKDKDKNSFVSGHYEVDGIIYEFEHESITDINNEELLVNNQIQSKSIFFPTFRRIEGGFSIDTNTRKELIKRNNKIIRGRILSRKEDQLNFALNDLSERISSNANNKFIASISTKDIISLLNSKYTEVLEMTGDLENTQSKKIQDKIRNKEKDKDEEILKQIEKIVENTDQEKSKLMRPFEVLSKLIKDIFQNKKIKISKTLTLGEAKEAITSDKLSAGEKQMLSFLCYNFFADNTAIFIDEPEISLHPDWQRLIFPTLLEQSTNNQFFVATHSPFIYSKYPSNEFVLDPNKGNAYYE
ncbi:MAG: AAA family ATPase [Bacteroidales bacterium]|nr:AAA family ATPase [Bacteroidales bacterium]